MLFFADYSILQFSEFFPVILPSVPIILSICTNSLTNLVFKQSQQIMEITNQILYSNNHNKIMQMANHQ